MRFSRLGYARISVCFFSHAPHLLHSEAERVRQLSLERSRLPCGPDFPPNASDMQAPGLPPDRAPLLLAVPKGRHPWYGPSLRLITTGRQ
jgi:hypothetical protein